MRISNLPRPVGRRGRPSTTGKYVGLWQAKKAAAEAEAPIRRARREPVKPVRSVAGGRPLSKRRRASWRRITSRHCGGSSRSATPSP